MIREVILQAIEELKQEFPSVRIEETGDGGAYITIPDFDYGEGWEPRIGWLGVTVPYMYPTAEVYPFFGPPAFRRAGLQTSIPGVTQGHSWHGSSAVQLSIRQRQWNENEHTLMIAVTGVQRYLTRCIS